VGPYTVTGFCTDQNDGFNDDVAEAYIGSSANDWAMTSTAAGGAGSGIFLDNTTTARLSQVFAVDGSDITAGDYTAVASNRFLAGEVLTGLNLIGADCVFGATGIG